MTAYTMRLSVNGQLSIPSSVRKRWNVIHMTVVDCGDHLVIRPTPEDPVAALAGKYAGSGPSSEAMRALARSEEEEREDDCEEDVNDDGPRSQKS